jgi:hypothetical protein
MEVVATVVYSTTAINHRCKLISILSPRVIIVNIFLEYNKNNNRIRIMHYRMQSAGTVFAILHFLCNLQMGPIR